MFGLFHNSEQNAFNLADDLIEPYRPVVDAQILGAYPAEPSAGLNRDDKARLVGLLHRDVVLTAHWSDEGACTLLVAIDATVTSLGRALSGQGASLTLPCLKSTLARVSASDIEAMVRDE